MLSNMQSFSLKMSAVLFNDQNHDDVIKRRNLIFKFKDQISLVIHKCNTFLKRIPNRIVAWSTQNYNTAFNSTDK